MTITKCDVCQKEIKGLPTELSIFSEFFVEAQLCKVCAKPVVEFVRKSKLDIESVFENSTSTYDQ